MSEKKKVEKEQGLRCVLLEKQKVQLIGINFILQQLLYYFLKAQGKKAPLAVFPKVSCVCVFNLGYIVRLLLGQPKRLMNL